MCISHTLQKLALSTMTNQQLDLTIVSLVVSPNIDAYVPACQREVLRGHRLEQRVETSSASDRPPDSL